MENCAYDVFVRHVRCRVGVTRVQPVQFPVDHAQVGQCRFPVQLKYNHFIK